jgi:hypothetical protein
MKERERKEGARMGEGQGAGGARARVGQAGSCWARLGRVGLGRTAGQNPVARTTTDRNPIREMKTETRLGKHAIKQDIRQKKYDSA